MNAKKQIKFLVAPLPCLLECFILDAKSRRSAARSVIFSLSPGLPGRGYEMPPERVRSAAHKQRHDARVRRGTREGGQGQARELTAAAADLHMAARALQGTDLHAGSFRNH